ncbi:MAG: TolC family protein [Endomicrobium sp.]|nr:TolC family protein [Endomicrobium sp.]
MKKIVTILFLLPIMFLGSYGYAEKINKALVDEQTLKNNPSIAVAKLELDNAKQAYYGSFDSFFPEATFSVASSQGISKEQPYGKKYSYGLKTSLSLFSGFQTYNGVKEQAAKVKVAQARYDRAVSDAMCTARLGYVDLMWAYETVGLSVQIRERRIKNKDLIKLKYNSGKADIGSLRIGEADVAMADYSLRKAQRHIETASASLLKAIGRNDDAVILETDEKIFLEQALPKPDYNSLITTIPEFLVAKYGQDVHKAHNAMIKGQWLPSISIFGNMGRISDKWSPDSEDWNAGIKASYPIFSGGRRYSDVKIASNGLKIASEKLKDEISGLKAKAAQHYNELIDAQEAIETKTYCLGALKLQAEISSKKYVNGLSTYSDWYAIEGNYISSQNELLDVKKDAARLRVKWDKFLGKGFANDKDRGK